MAPWCGTCYQVLTKFDKWLCKALIKTTKLCNNMFLPKTLHFQPPRSINFILCWHLRIFLHAVCMYCEIWELGSPKGHVAPVAFRTKTGSQDVQKHMWAVAPPHCLSLCVSFRTVTTCRKDPSDDMKPQFSKRLQNAAYFCTLRKLKLH